MFNLSENYQLRKYFFERNQVPTQSVMKKKMSPALADVYFKSMSHKLRVIAGFEPPMKGGGNDWIVSPAALLQGKTVLKPLARKHMVQWNWNGVDKIGMRLVQIHRDRMLAEKHHLITEHNQNWEEEINKASHQEWMKRCAAAGEVNTRYIENVVREFEALYSTSITKLQDLMFDAAVNSIKQTRKEAFEKMQKRYEDLLHEQATILYDRFTKRLMRKKDRLKKKFIHDLEVARTRLGDQLHDINLEKHVAIEKLRHFLECQTLACQAYIAMKERQECSKETEYTKQKHTRKMNTYAEDIKYMDFKIFLSKKKEQRRQEFETIWKKKVCHVVKNFQTFISYCLKMLPEHAEFFINMEKLMLLQLSKALEDPHVDSIIVIDVETFETPIPQPHPFYLFCDKSYKPKINKDLCPKHCTSSATEMPVIVINKRCIYAACDNFEQFTDKVKDYVDGRGGEDADFVDYHDYTRNVPVKYTVSQQLQDLKLESSLLQILQQEIANARDVPIVCGGCKIPHCFYCSRSSSTLASQISPHPENAELKQPSLASIQSVDQNLTRELELQYQREPKWENYLRYVKTKKCDCTKIAKKHLMDNLPIYMRKMSTYDAPELLNYEICPLESLKSLVKIARGKVTPPIPSDLLSQTKEIATQYSDQEFEYLCTCFSDDNLLSVFAGIDEWSKLSNLSYGDNQFRVVGDSLSSTYLTKGTSSFATDRAFSLKKIITESPEFKEIFSRKDCVYD